VHLKKGIEEQRMVALQTSTKIGYHLSDAACPLPQQEQGLQRRRSKQAMLRAGLQTGRLAEVATGSISEAALLENFLFLIGSQFQECRKAGFGAVRHY
jgi:hypothetical protein